MSTALNQSEQEDELSNPVFSQTVLRTKDSDMFVTAHGCID